MISTWFNVEQLHVELLGADPKQSISCTLLSLVMERVAPDDCDGSNTILRRYDLELAFLRCMTFQSSPCDIPTIV